LGQVLFLQTVDYRFGKACRLLESSCHMDASSCGARARQRYDERAIFRDLAHSGRRWGVLFWPDSRLSGDEQSPSGTDVRGSLSNGDGVRVDRS
jgi:hypothetical protein